MAYITNLLKSQPITAKPKQEETLNEEEFDEFLTCLPKEKGWRTSNLFLFQGFWCQPKEIRAIISTQNHFIAQDTDLIIASIPKSGTTWLKALTFAIVNRKNFSVVHNQHHPLLTQNPHELVPFLEYKLYADSNRLPNLSLLPSPRLLATHVPFGALPDSIKTSNCKIVYICRNPFDTFISIWHYLNKIRPESLVPLAIEEAFDLYCNGVIGFGPYWDHMLSYWREIAPNKVLFLKYEEMKVDACNELKKLGEFLGFPFTEEEEKEGVIEDISNLCSFQNMKDLEVNKIGKGAILDFENRDLFRKGEIGDWMNYFTPSMFERLSNVMEEKLQGTGLTFTLR